MAHPQDANKEPETGVLSEIIPPAATQPWLMTMRSSKPFWKETLVFTESYRRLLVPETLIFFELVDLVAGLSLKEARKVCRVTLHAFEFFPRVKDEGSLQEKLLSCKEVLYLLSTILRRLRCIRPA